MAIRVIVLSLMFLYLESVSSFCDHVFSKRFSKEYIIRKNVTFELRDDCLSGVVLQSKFDGSFYCLSKNQKFDRTEKLTCLVKDGKEVDCQCGIENPPPSSTNRIMYPAGMRQIT